MTLRLGAIGWRNHAARIIDLADASGLGRVEVVHHPDYVPARPGGTTRFEDLLDCDAVLILSPNDTHGGYLRRLAGYGGYVFCEKPPVTTRADWEMLRTLDAGRTCFGFNLRFSRWAERAREAVADGRLGRVLHAEVQSTHGLAFKDIFPGSWRADGARHRHSVLETVAVHFVDLLGHLLGPIERWDYAPSNAAGRGTAYDTCHLATRHAGGATSSVLASYAAPFALRLSLLGSNGVLTCDPQGIALHGPRDTFDARGNFAAPPERFREDADFDTVFRESLARSLAFFLEHARDRRPLPPELFDLSVRTTGMVLDVTDEARSDVVQPSC
ncbi:MAG TPA: Gfo/Idh/MocA family oxidoreductase [Azospirillum sp.]|nr:Gfo/Idh/MocA family oxidoreductase [Azospirillum sp.]